MEDKKNLSAEQMKKVTGGEMEKIWSNYLCPKCKKYTLDKHCLVFGEDYDVCTDTSCGYDSRNEPGGASGSW